MLASQTPPTTPVVLPNSHREEIDWNENYGHSFKIVETPNEMVREDSTMIVTPKNIEEWGWDEVSEQKLCKLKRNWNIIQKNLSEHKYNQILDYVKNIEKCFV